jgi:tRNA-2-methylthio-N6-dimethylallyladenosine synthase
MADLSCVCEHIHLPVQAGSDRVLSGMKRGYTSRQYMEKVEMLKKLIPEVEFTTDIIVGFPGEEREDFQRTLDLLSTVKYQNVFSFRFSPRPGTAAAAMEDNVLSEVRRPWLPELQDLQNQITAEKHRNMVGRVVEVLAESVDKKKNGFLKGRTRTNYIVHFPGDPALEGTMVPVKLVKSRTIYLIGEMVK